MSAPAGKAGPPFSVRQGTDADIPAILALMRRSLGEGNIPRTPEFWAWKHQQNPFGRSPFLLAESEGRLVGVRVFMRWEWRAGERTFRAVRAVDTATDPEFQGRGIFKKLTLGLVEQVRAEGVDFVFNTPNDQSRPGYLKMGWSSLGRVSLWARPVGLRGAGRIVGRVLARALGRAASGQGEPSDEGAGEGAVAAGHGSAPGQRGLTPVEAAVFAAPLGVHLHTPKSAEYLRWRYASCPAFDYRVQVAPRAVVTSRVRERFGLRELTLCDVLFEPSSRGLSEARALLAETLRDSGADYAIAALPRGKPTLRLLAASGFVPVRNAGPILTVRPLAEGTPAVVLSRERWAPSVGDLELF